jgi:Glycosyltransferase family 87
MPQRPPEDSRERGVKAALRDAMALTVLAGVIAAFLFLTVIPAAGRTTHGFLAYYVGAQTIRNGEPAARLYDDEWFSARVAGASAGKVHDIYWVNSPILAVAWVPFAHLQAAQARKLWVWMSVLWLGLAIAMSAQLLVHSRRPCALAGIVALFTLPMPVHEQFLVGQMYSLVLLLHVVGWSAYTRRRDAVAGVALGLAMALKLSGWPIGLLMVAQGRWSAVRWSVSTIAVAVIATLPWVGAESWRTLIFVVIPDALRSPFAMLTAYQDSTGLWQHWFRYDAQWNPNPIVDAPALAGVLTAGTAAAACLALVARRRPAYVSFAAAMALTELISPFAEQYHYVVLLLPLAVLWHESWLFRSKGALCAALLATALISWPIDYKAPHPDWAVWLSYPRLIGGWIAFTALLLTWGDRNRLIGNRLSAAQTLQSH